MRDKNLDYDLLRENIRQWREVAPNYYGDYYPLTPYSVGSDMWLGWQFHRPEVGEGMVQMFCRPGTMSDSGLCRLKALDSQSRYEIRDFDKEESIIMTGQQLMEKGLRITFEEQPGAALIQYQQMPDIKQLEEENAELKKRVEMSEKRSEELYKQAWRNRPVQSAWKRSNQNLLWNFHNLYQPCVVEVAGRQYPYKMWFMGWAVEDNNPRYPGSDAIYHARSKDLKAWQVYAGKAGWDSEMKPECWVPVITADDKPYDACHNGDPSVVYKDGRYYMAFSSTGMPGVLKDGGDHGMVVCVMGATSEDGISWQKTAQPLLIESEETVFTVARKGTMDFARPCLRWDEGKWKLWFDYTHPTMGCCTGYSENTSDFGKEGGFRITHDLAEPLIPNWPNPEMVRVGNQYHSFADPGGYPGGRGWTSRQLCEAVSADGLNWKIVGYIPPDGDAAALHTAQTLVTNIEGKTWLYLFYATQKGGPPTDPDDVDRYDWRYNRIRAMRREVKNKQSY